MTPHDLYLLIGLLISINRSAFSVYEQIEWYFLFPSTDQAQDVLEYLISATISTLLLLWLWPLYLWFKTLMWLEEQEAKRNGKS